MFYCVLHNWSSSEKPCPACFKIVTTSSSTQLIPDISKDVFTEQEVRKMMEELIDTNKCISSVISDFKQSKSPYEFKSKLMSESEIVCPPQTANVSKKRIEVKISRQEHRDPRIKPLELIISPTHGISEYQLPKIKQAIESVLNNENGYYTIASMPDLKLYTQQQVDSIREQIWNAAKAIIPDPSGFAHLVYKYPTLQDYMQFIKNK